MDVQRTMDHGCIESDCMELPVDLYCQRMEEPEHKGTTETAVLLADFYFPDIDGAVST